jgi:SOS response regulatory protein OraA/RecX
MSDKVNRFEKIEEAMENDDVTIKCQEAVKVIGKGIKHILIVANEKGESASADYSDVEDLAKMLFGFSIRYADFFKAVKLASKLLDEGVKEDNIREIMREYGVDPDTVNQ